eukprot:Gb_22037 [translate_table: standard]
MVTPDLDPHKIQEHFEDFYEDIFEEISKFGEIENLNICDNLIDHMVRNVYVNLQERNRLLFLCWLGRFYSGRPIIMDFSPMTNF